MLQMCEAWEGCGRGWEMCASRVRAQGEEGACDKLGLADEWPP